MAPTSDCQAGRIATCDGCAVLRPVVVVEGSYLCAECEPELGSIGPKE